METKIANPRFVGSVLITMFLLLGWILSDLLVGAPLPSWDMPLSGYFAKVSPLTTGTVLILWLIVYVAVLDGISLLLRARRSVYVIEKLLPHAIVLSMGIVGWSIASEMKLDNFMLIAFVIIGLAIGEGIETKRLK